MFFIINGYEWEVYIVQPNDRSLLKPDGTYALGSCDSRDYSIYISSAGGGEMKKVLCHEIVHAAMYSYNVLLDCEQEELIAELISTFGEEIIDITNAIFYQLIK